MACISLDGVIPALGSTSEQILRYDFASCSGLVLMKPTFREDKPYFLFECFSLVMSCGGWFSK
jgi:hypothetical protein